MRKLGRRGRGERHPAEHTHGARVRAVVARLPIDGVLPDVVAAVRDRGVAVLVAPPGAGKTTRVPGALLDAGAVTGEIVVLQPRRLAARMAAARVASERGGELGARGRLRGAVRSPGRGGDPHPVRHRGRADPAAARGPRAARRRRGDHRRVPRAPPRRRPRARARRAAARRPARAAARRDVRDARRRAGRRVPRRCAGHPLGGPDVPARDRVRRSSRTIASSASRSSAAVRRLAQDKLDGDVLVFLPGAGEIRRVAEDLADAAAIHDLAVLPLHGDLTADEQDARGPSEQQAQGDPRDQRRGDVASPSTAWSRVIDCGLARIARHSPWTGLASLQVEPVSRASCAQRAGRAGRTRAGPRGAAVPEARSRHPARVRGRPRSRAPISPAPRSSCTAPGSPG